MEDRAAELFNPDLAGRPTLIRGDTQILFPGMGHLNENCVINIKNKSYSVTAQVVVPANGASGVLLAQGGSPTTPSRVTFDGFRLMSAVTTTTT